MTQIFTNRRKNVHAVDRATTEAAGQRAGSRMAPKSAAWRAVEPAARKRAFGAARKALVVACALWLAACLVASPAWADEDILADEGNNVNARQTADNSFLYDTSVYELTQADATYQGNTVQIVGEVVGDTIRAEEDPGKRWITLEAIEEEYESSISVLVSESDISLIDTYGGYNRKGTTLQVRGTFYLACPSHEGIIDIHADAVTLVAHGSQTTDEFDIGKFVPGIVLCVIGLLLTLLYRLLRERER